MSSKAHLQSAYTLQISATVPQAPYICSTHAYIHSLRQCKLVFKAMLLLRNIRLSEHYKFQFNLVAMTFSFRNRATFHYSTGKKVCGRTIIRGNIKWFPGSYQTHDLCFIRIKMQSVGSITNALHRTMADCVEGGESINGNIWKSPFCFSVLRNWVICLSSACSHYDTHEPRVKPTRRPRGAQILGARSPGLYTMVPIFVGHQYGTCFVSLFWCLEFWGGFWNLFFIENLWTPV